jgi:hypothetical protein
MSTPVAIARRRLTTMQPLAAYYVFVANEEARNASRRPYRAVPPKKTGRSRFGAAVSALVRPIRGAASSPA